MSNRVHHLNCATMAPRSVGRLVPGRMVAHCLLVERDHGLVLVDTGFGSGDLASPRQRLGAAFLAIMRPSLDLAETAREQVRALGHEPADVTDIVLTHLDLDHAGGIGDFPAARVHVFADELEAAHARRSLRERGRYVPAQWAHRPRWLAHDPRVGEHWFGFEAVTVLSEDILLVPLRGHTRGHCGVAVRRPAGGWFLHAGDAYFHHTEKGSPPHCPAGLRIFQTVMQMEGRARRDNAERLRSLRAEHRDEVTVFCAHSATELDELVGVTD